MSEAKKSGDVFVVSLLGLAEELLHRRHPMVVCFGEVKAGGH